MMSSIRIETLRAAWSDLDGVGGGGREYRAKRVAEAVQGLVYAGLREADGALALIFESPLRPLPIRLASFHGEGISITEDRHLEDETYRVIVTVERTAFAGVFEIICLDLLDRTRDAADARECVRIAATQLGTWVAALRRAGTGLTAEAAIGLFGELTVLDRIADHISLDRAVAVWTGPEDGLHDFAGAGCAIEVKTLSGPGSGVWVSTLDQLDDRGLAHLTLAVVRIVPDPAGVTLGALVTGIRDRLSSHAGPGLSSFERLLVSVGWMGSDGDSMVPFRVADVAFFGVTEGFPRITRATVPEQVQDARYRLGLDGLEAFRTAPADEAAILQRFGDS